MILSCNSCEKKFVVPDSAIGPNGRLVQCSSCGNKWKQFPINKEVKKPVKKEIKTKQKSSSIKSSIRKKEVNLKTTKRKIKKRTGPDLYSPEYLAKKHGIKIDSKPISQKQTSENKKKIGFGFYNYLIVYTVIFVVLLRLIYFTQDMIVDRFPASDIYINHLFESIRNIKDIILNFFQDY